MPVLRKEEWPSGYGVRLESAWEQSLAGSSPVSSARNEKRRYP